MQEKEQLDSVFDELREEEKTTSKKKKIILALCFIGALIYLLFLLFGSNSWSVLIGLKREKSKLEERVEKLRGENVELQKKIFELKGLEPSNEEQK